MKRIIPILSLIVFYNSSCKSVKNIFSDSKTPHEKYADKLEDKHMDETPEGRLWMAVSKRALEDPQPIQLPYRQNGYFHDDRPHSLALLFKANAGERITFTLTRKSVTPLAIFADIFKDAEKPTHLLSADTARNQFSFDANETSNYILRLQPQLYHKGEYTLSVSVGPSLGFPVSGDKASVGSFWGANRDGGKRSHEGIDIFAPKLTPAVAAEDGVVTGVKEGGLGGKQVWLKVSDRNAFLYYAHLDKQLVTEGQAVKKGDVVGLVGNTGNAQHTASHLHFGVYTSSGPIDPFPFVNRSIRNPAAIPAKNLAGSFKLIKSMKTGEGILVPANTVLVPLAANAKGYLAELPDGRIIQTSFNAVKVLAQPVRPASIVASVSFNR